jgi:undecaprenyl-diphosphatase
VALGALQGPTELLPVSSSGHLILVPRLLGWPYADLDPELRKSFEVALHVGAAGALLIAFRHEAAGVLLAPRRILGVALAFVPPAVAAVLFERSIEERLGVPRRVAAAQVAAGAALAAADRLPALRAEGTAGPADHLLIGVGQAAALVPGVSRGGATLTAARLRRFQRPAASRLSRHAALPVILGAAALKGVRLARRGLPVRLAGPFAAGAGAAFLSTLAAARLVKAVDRATSYRPFGVYRMALGTVSLVRLRLNGSDDRGRGGLRPRRR